jgi:SAM-dependent methyltransferase
MVERLVPGDKDWIAHSAHHLARYAFAAEFARGRRVLDAGCGSGYGARLLKSAGASLVLGVDVCPEAVQLAQQHFGCEGVSFLVDDCQRLDQVPGEFNLICNFENLEHLSEPERFLEAVGRRLAPDGILLVSSPDRAASPPFVNGRPRNAFHVTEWYLDEFRSLVSRYFADVELRVQVESTGLARRREAVEALREGLMVSNPLFTFLWRKWPAGSRKERAWKRLSGLAAPSVSDYPILPPGTASLFGSSAFHVAICRKPRPNGSRSET